MNESITGMNLFLGSNKPKKAPTVSSITAIFPILISLENFSAYFFGFFYCFFNITNLHKKTMR